MLYKLLVILVIVFAIKSVQLWLFYSNKENFYNILPTELIDPDYYNINQDPLNYYNHLRVGDTHGVDLNCNNVNLTEILDWIKNNNPDVLYKYVYINDPSIDTENPIYAPRVLKMLLTYLPEQHPYIPILRKCFPYKVRIA